MIQKLNIATLEKLKGNPYAKKEIEEWRKAVNSFDEYCSYLNFFVERHEGDNLIISDVNENAANNAKYLEDEIDYLVIFTQRICNMAKLAHLEPLMPYFSAETGTIIDVLQAHGKHDSVAALKDNLLERLRKIA